MILTRYTKKQKLTGRRNATKVADAIEYESIEGLGFDMRVYLICSDDWCKTTACMAGHAFVLARGCSLEKALAVKYEFGHYTVHDVAARALALNDTEARRLFTGNTGATRAEAVAVLRHYAATGEVCVPGRMK